MTRFSEDMHAALGALDQEMVGRPGVVVVVPDNYLPSPRPIGVGGVGNLAAAVGFRSEIAIACQTIGNRPDIGVELFDLWVRTDTALATIEFVNAQDAVFAGYTAVQHLASDLAWNVSSLRVFTKNSAVALAATRTRFTTTQGAVANEWTYTPGKWLLRGAPNQNILIVRPTLDNRSIGVKFGYRELEKRKL